MSETSSFWIVIKPEDDNLKVSYVDDRGVQGNIVFKILRFICDENKDSSIPSNSDLLKVSQAFVIAKVDQELRRNHTLFDPTIVPMPEMFIGVRKKQWSLPTSTDNSLPTLAHTFSRRTDDDAVVKLAQDWLTTCLRDHRNTCSHAPGYTPPRPLVYLTSEAPLSNLSCAKI